MAGEVVGKGFFNLNTLAQSSQLNVLNRTSFLMGRDDV